jgi:hypothetical protein
MDTCIKLPIGDIVTYSTVYSFQLFRMREFFHIGILVTVDAV